MKSKAIFAVMNTVAEVMDYRLVKKKSAKIAFKFIRDML